jgi:DegV family protein with EDD domain
MQAKKMIQEEFSNRFIHVFDSKSASVGETLISLKINEFISQNLKKLEIVERVNEYINEMKTFFVLESMDNLAKAGRLNPLIAKAASILSIKPILGEENGKIRLVDKVRGHDRALRRMLDVIGDEGKKLEEKILGIAHCNCLQRALDFKDKVLKKYRFKDVIIVDTAGISTTYANDGGLIIAF